MSFNYDGSNCKSCAVKASNKELLEALRKVKEELLFVRDEYAMDITIDIISEAIEKATKER